HRQGANDRTCLNTMPRGLHADRYLRGQYEIRRPLLSSPTVLGDLGGVAVEIPYREIDLPESNLHFLKCKTLRKMMSSSGANLAMSCSIGELVGRSFLLGLTVPRWKLYTPLFLENMGRENLAWLNWTDLPRRFLPKRQQKL